MNLGQAIILGGWLPVGLSLLYKAFLISSQKMQCILLVYQAYVPRPCFVRKIYNLYGVLWEGGSHNCTQTFLTHYRRKSTTFSVEI